MRIGVFHNLPPGGAKRLAYDFSRELSKRGHRIDFFTTDTNEDKLFSIRPYSENVYEYTCSPERPLRIFRPYFVWRYTKLLRKANHFLGLRRCHKRIGAEIKKRKYDVVFIHACVTTQSPFLLRFLRDSAVYYANEPLRRIYDEPRKRTPRPAGFLAHVSFFLADGADLLERLMVRHIDKKNIRCAGFIVTSSHHTRKRLLQTYDVSSTVSYPGVEQDRFMPLRLKTENYVLSVGAITPKKRHDFVIDALARITKAIRPRLVIIANFAYEDCLKDIRALAAAKEVDLNTRLLVSDEELVLAYNQAQAVIYAPEQEPFGLVPLEAMACGTPVIGVREGGVPETISDGLSGILIDRNEMECAAAIERILSNDRFRRDLGQNSIDYVRRHWGLAERTSQLETLLLRTAGLKTDPTIERAT